MALTDPLREDTFTSRRRETFRSPTLSTTTNIPPPVAPVATPPIVVNPPVNRGVITTPGDDDDLDLDPRNDVVLPPTTGFGVQGGFSGAGEEAAAHGALNALTPDIDFDPALVARFGLPALTALLTQNPLPLVRPVFQTIQESLATGQTAEEAAVAAAAAGSDSPTGTDPSGVTDVNVGQVAAAAQAAAEQEGLVSFGGDVGDVGGAVGGVGVDSGAGGGTGDVGGLGGIGEDAGGPGDADGEADGAPGAGGEGAAGGDAGGPAGGQLNRGGKVHARRSTGFKHGGKVGTPHAYNIGGAVPPSMLPFNIGGVVQDIERGQAGNPGEQQNNRAFSNGGEVPPAPQGAPDPAGPDDQFVDSPNGMASIQAGEFIIPKEVVDYLGEKHLRNLVSNARKDLGLDTDAQANGAGASSGSGTQAPPAVAAALPQPPVTAPGAPLDPGDGGGGGDLTLQPASQPIGNPALALSDPQAAQAAPRRPDPTGFMF